MRNKMGNKELRIKKMLLLITTTLKAKDLVTIIIKGIAI